MGRPKAEDTIKPSEQIALAAVPDDQAEQAGQHNHHHPPHQDFRRKRGGTGEGKIGKRRKLRPEIQPTIVELFTK